jgi:hypothetical protein
MKRIANLVLTIGIVGLVLCGTEAWLASREPERSAAPLIASSALGVSVAGVSHTLDVVVADQIDESVDSTAEATVEGTVEAIAGANAEASGEKTGNLDAYVFDPPNAGILASGRSSDVFALGLDEWAFDDDDDDSFGLSADDDEDASAEGDLDLVGDDWDETAGAEADEI